MSRVYYYASRRVHLPANSKFYTECRARLRHRTRRLQESSQLVPYLLRRPSRDPVGLAYFEESVRDITVTTP